ncbi:MAG: hypothetical protein WC716_09025 [Chitinophagaceae bacterium]
MKEIDLRTLEKLLTDQYNKTQIKYLAIFLVLNILIAVINWLIQRNVKKIENRIYKNKVREDRRIVVIEKIYSDLVEFTYFFDQKSLLIAFPKISEIEKYTSEMKLYIPDSLQKKILNYTDYIKSICADFRKKDFKLEAKLLKEIEVEFNK